MWGRKRLYFAYCVPLPGSAVQKMQNLGSHISTTVHYTGPVSLHLV